MSVTRRIKSVFLGIAPLLVIAATLALVAVAGRDPADAPGARLLQAPTDDFVCCGGQPAYDSTNTDGQAGSGGRAVAYRPGGRATGARGPDARLFRTGYGGWEPTLGLDKKGTIFYAARNSNVDPQPLRSTDGGVTWKAVAPKTGSVNTHTSSLDPYLWVDRATGRVFDTDIDPTVTCTPVSRTDDAGESWTTSAACGAFDHQSLFGGPPPAGGEKPTGYPNVVYFCAISGGALADSSTFSSCTKSLDGGGVFTLTGEPAYPPRTSPPGSAWPYCDGGHGHGVVDSKGNVYLPRGWCREPYLAISRDEGDSWTRVRVPGRLLPVSDEEVSGVHEAGVAVDGAGNVYYSWVGDNHHPYLAISRDRGRTWGKPMNLRPPGVTRVSAMTASIDVGAPGRVAIVYMGTRDPARTPEEETTWDGYMVTSVTALNSNPTFYAASVNDPETNTLWKGSCGDVRCGNTGDFMDVVVGPEGTPWAAFVDSCPNGDECTGFSAATPRGEAILGRLVGGPSLR
jgi:hypothetical protein